MFVTPCCVGVQRRHLTDLLRLQRVPEYCQVCRYCRGLRAAPRFLRNPRITKQEMIEEATKLYDPSYLPIMGHGEAQSL
jgi:hypothetical protein